MTPVTDDLLREMTEAVVSEVRPETVILFGSHATGTARPDSDVDLLVIESAPFGKGRDRRAELGRMCRALARFPVAKDILVYSRDEVERWRGSRNHVIAVALREGRTLHGRP
jgi:predicted nucleotidyltransferase